MLRPAQAIAAVVLMAFLPCLASEQVPSFVKRNIAQVTAVGQVDDASCSVEAVEEANNSQLHEILEAIMNTTYFRMFKSKPQPLLKKAPTLCSLSKQKSPFGMPAASSKMEKSIPWSPLSDRADKSVTAAELSATTAPAKPGEGCKDPNLPEFWLDMCSHIPTNSSEYVNLQLNPERWTGYNGSHVWAAIYKENCFSKRVGVSDMCYEEPPSLCLLFDPWAPPSTRTPLHE